MLYLENEKDDYFNVLSAMDGFAEGFGITLDIDLQAVESVVRGMRHKFPARGGSEMASPFKKAANFLCYFVSEGPVKSPFAESIVGANIARIDNHQNAVLGLYIAFEALHYATIWRRDGTVVVLENKISMSGHSYCDTVQACHRLTPVSHFHLVSVFLEQLCYRTNPDAAYPAAF